MKNKVNEKIKELQDIVLKNWSEIHPILFDVSYDLKSTKTLGQANYKYNKIRLNENLLEEFGEKYINEVVVHEFAHFIVIKLYPKGINDRTKKRVMPHGKEFKQVCRVLGIKGKATTDIFSDSKTLKSKNTKKVKCSCREHEVSTRLFNKIVKNSHCRVCAFCGEGLFPIF